MFFLLQTGMWDTSCTISNPLNTTGTTCQPLSLYMMQDILGFSVKDEQITSVKKMETKSLKVRFTARGTNMCLRVSWETDLPMEIYGSGACPTAGTVFKGRTMDDMTISHVYQKSGTYEVVVTAYTAMQSFTEKVPVTISSSPCVTPGIIISQCSKDYQSPILKRGDQQFTVPSTIDIRCNTTTANKKSWIVDRLDDAFGKFVLHVNLDGVLSATQSELVIDKYKLAVGLYKFKLKIDMVIGTTEQYPAVKECYFRVTRGFLRAKLIPSPAAKIMVGYGSAITFNAMENSVDEDLDANVSCCFLYWYQ